MLALRGALNDTQQQALNGNGEQLPKATRLFMPSEILSSDLRGSVCAIGLAEVEAWMREAEAMEALEAVRYGLRTRTMTNRFRLRHYTGQGLMTKGQGILRQINIRIHIAKLHYRYSRTALLMLRGHGDWQEALRVLKDEDVRALNECALTEEEKAQNDHWVELGGGLSSRVESQGHQGSRGERAHTPSPGFGIRLVSAWMRRIHVFMMVSAPLLVEVRNTV
jgi:hypothetical protein